MNSIKATKSIPFFIACLFSIAILVSCGTKESRPDDRDAFLHSDCVIESYLETSDGLLITAKDIDNDTVKFLVSNDTQIRRIPIYEKIYAMEIGLAVEVYSETWVDGMDNVHSAKYVNPASSTDTQ